MKYALRSVLDVMRVRPSGDPQIAVVPVDDAAPAKIEVCDILIGGGGMGGVAAALAAARRGHNVCLLEETDWLGGQMTSQGVSALDEHDHIEAFGGTRAYYEMREAIRDHYRNLAVPVPTEPTNPGNCWVSRLAFEPSVAVAMIDRLLAPYVTNGRLRIFLRTRIVGAEVIDDEVVNATAIDLDRRQTTGFRFKQLIDATELGDLLPLVGADYVVGAESVEETGERHAQPVHARPQCVQSCSYIFAMERREPGKGSLIPKPDGYEHYRDSQPYSLSIHVHGGEIYGEQTGWLQFKLFDDAPDTKGPLWKYRRLVDAGQFGGRYPNDITMFNWPGNDYRDLPLVDQSPDVLAQALQDAKRVALGFAYWLQTTASEAGAAGQPDLLLRPDIMDTADGLSKYPYIRESRRIKAVRTIVEQDVAEKFHPGPRAAHFDDSVGVGWYPIDIHQAGEGDLAVSTRTKPFQIPLGALIPRTISNLLAANKNIGTTHLTNGCYRLHPIEWNIGEAAGVLAAVAIEADMAPKAVHSERVRVVQRELVAEGVPLCWLVDVPVTHPAFSAIQRLVMAAGYGGTTLRP